MPRILRHTKPTDPELVGMCLQRDSMAWETLLRRYRRLIYSIPVGFGFQKSDCDDIYQNVCITLYQQLDTVKEIGKLYSWLMTTAFHECVAVAKQNKKELGTENGDKAEEALDPADVEKNAIDAELLYHMRETVALMLQRCRLLIEMLYLDPVTKSYEEIAPVLGLSVQAIGRQRARCLVRLLWMLKKRGLI